MEGVASICCIVLAHSLHVNIENYVAQNASSTSWSSSELNLPERKANKYLLIAAKFVCSVTDVHFNWL